MYYELTERLSYDPEKPGDAERARKQLDSELKIKRWRISESDTDPYADAVQEEWAPWWWDGEEEASASFLAAQGVNLGDRNNGGGGPRSG